MIATRNSNGGKRGDSGGKRLKDHIKELSFVKKNVGRRNSKSRSEKRRKPAISSSSPNNTR